MNELRLYHQAILDAAAERTGHGALDKADVSATLDNPLCGDRVRMDVSLKESRLARVGHEVRGCLLCEAAASVIGARAPGERVTDLRQLAGEMRTFLKGTSLDVPNRWPALKMFAPVAHHKSRHECVMLPFDALVKALDEWEKG